MATRAIQIGFLLAGLRDPDTLLPLNAGTVEFYEVGTSTPKNVWTEEAKTNAFTSYTLDANGVAELYGDGNYKIVVKDSTGATEYTFDEVKLEASAFNRRTVSGATETATPDDDLILCDTSSNNMTLNLQTVADFTRPLNIKKISGSNTLTVDPSGAQAIDGDSTIALTEDNESLTIDPDTNATTWRRRGHIATTLLGLLATITQLNYMGKGFRVSRLDIVDATDAAEIKCRMVSIYNGDAVNYVDNIDPGAGETGGFTLVESGDPSVLEIADSIITDSFQGVVAAIVASNTTGTDVAVSQGTGSTFELEFSAVPSGGNLDLSTLVDSGSLAIIVIYLTG